MTSRHKYKGGYHYHLFLLVVLLAILATACGEFVRDHKSTPDVDKNQDAGFDIEMDQSQDAPTDSYEELKDIKEDTYIDVGEDIFYDTQSDTVSDEITFLDTDFDENIEPDPSDVEDYIAIDDNRDISYYDVIYDVYEDTSSSCDCGAGNSCGKCYYPGTDGLTNQALKDKLYQIIKDHTSLGYDSARVKMFSEIDNKDGWVECVYTGFRLKTSGVPDANIMNTEHTWPQSAGAGSEPARSDLFHLFPTKSDANSRRANYPFGTVVNTVWSEGGSKLGTDANGVTVFEPRDVHKGNVARAMFYFSVRYRLPIDNKQEAELKKWHTLDPVDTDEIERCNKISSYQHNRNPFVDWPDFVNRIEDF